MTNDQGSSSRLLSDQVIIEAMNESGFQVGDTAQMWQQNQRSTGESGPPSQQLLQNRLNQDLVEQHKHGKGGSHPQNSRTEMNTIKSSVVSYNNVSVKKIAQISKQFFSREAQMVNRIRKLERDTMKINLRKNSLANNLANRAKAQEMRNQKLLERTQHGEQLRLASNEKRISILANNITH